MYDLPDFKEKNTDEVVRFMKVNPFAMLIGCHENIAEATQVPFLFEERHNKLYLQGHIMKNTGHHKTLLRNNAVLCVFTGADTYVSASLTTTPATGSTWNYMSVHARGNIRFLNTEALVDILRKTTNHYENDPSSPANFEHIPYDYVNKLGKAIDGFEIEVTSIEHVFKLSQDKNRESYRRITEKLKVDGGKGSHIAAEMEKRKDSLFG